MTEREDKLRAELRKHAAICKRALMVKNSVKYGTQRYCEAVSEYDLSSRRMTELQNALAMVDDQVNGNG